METSHAHSSKVFWFFRPFISIVKHLKILYKGDKYNRYRKHETEFNGEKNEDDLRNSKEPYVIEVPELSLEELINQTNNFDSSSLIGKGSHGKVYYAKLQNQREIALKKLNFPSNLAISDIQLLTVLSIASRLKHENYIELLGYCVKDDLCLLAYEYAPMGSLHDILHGSEQRRTLTWHQRITIALDIAKGLEYLHEKKRPSIIHKNIRSGNILLFEGFFAKVADYDIFNQVSDINLRPHSVNLLGTLAYTAPEYCMSGKMTTKSDVYSFGVVLLELLTGRKALDKTLPRDQRSLVTWAVPLLMNGNVQACIDRKFNGEYPAEQAIKLGQIAALCMQFEPESRPVMSVVVRNLEANMIYH